MKKIIVIAVFIFIFALTAQAVEEKSETNEVYGEIPHIKTEEITSQPYKVELIDNKTPQTQNTITLKNANDVNLHTLKTGDKILFTLPNTVNLETGAKIPAGTKFSATVVLKESRKIKIIINEIIFTDTKNYIIISKYKKAAPLKTISAERILGKNAKVTGIFYLKTSISSVNFAQRGIKSEPDTTTAVGICILLKTGARTLKAGTPVTISFNNNLRPAVSTLK